MSDSNGHRNAEQMPAWEVRDPFALERIAKLEQKLAKAERAIRFFLEPGVEWDMEAWLEGSGPPPPEPALRRVLELEASLRALIERIRRVGGYATPEEQDSLLRAERVLKGDRI